jgi:hypothetical protein
VGVNRSCRSLVVAAILRSSTSKLLKLQALSSGHRSCRRLLFYKNKCSRMCGGLLSLQPKRVRHSFHAIMEKFLLRVPRTGSLRGTTKETNIHFIYCVNVFMCGV